MDIRADTAAKNPDLIALLAQGGLQVVITGLRVAGPRGAAALREEPAGRPHRRGDQGLPRQRRDAPRQLHRPAGLRGGSSSPTWREYAARHAVAFAGYTILTPMPGTPFHREVAAEIVDRDLAKYNFFNCVLKTKLPLERFYEQVGARLAPEPRPADAGRPDPAGARGPLPRDPRHPRRRDPPRRLRPRGHLELLAQIDEAYELADRFRAAGVPVSSAARTSASCRWRRARTPTPSWSATASCTGPPFSPTPLPAHSRPGTAHSTTTTTSPLRRCPPSSCWISSATTADRPDEPGLPAPLRVLRRLRALLPPLPPEAGGQGPRRAGPDPRAVEAPVHRPLADPDRNGNDLKGTESPSGSAARVSRSGRGAVRTAGGTLTLTSGNAKIPAVTNLRDRGRVASGLHIAW